MNASRNRLATLRWRLPVLAIGAASLCACEQKMANQPRYEPLEASRFFADGMSARPMVEGTVARGESPQQPAFIYGVEEEVEAALAEVPSLESSVNYVDQIPLPVSKELLAAGARKYGIYCAPCHAADGRGSGRVVQHGYPQAQSFHTERLRQAPIGYLVAVTTRGRIDMPAFGLRIPPGDRWAIAAHIRVLQRGWPAEGRSFEQWVAETLGAPREDRANEPPRAIPTDAGSGRFVEGPSSAVAP